MRVLLDECIPRKLKAYLVGHECQTVPEAGWAGKKNGELLKLAECRYDAFVTLVERQITGLLAEGEQRLDGRTRAVLAGGLETSLPQPGRVVLHIDESDPAERLWDGRKEPTDVSGVSARRVPLTGDNQSSTMQAPFSPEARNLGATGVCANAVVSFMTGQICSRTGFRSVLPR